MIYGSVCSGIEAATVAWHPLGWEAAWYSEIEKFPSAILSHHYPKTPNLGDMTKLLNRSDFHERPIDLLVGGTPCQSFSIAGLRKGLDDPRGNLALIFLGLLGRSRARWVVWENVPGVLSSADGRDFASFLSGLSGRIVNPPAEGWQNSGIIEQHGPGNFGLAWRVLDAQHFGVPQRRRRVFVVGYLGDWRRPAAVLFERHSLSGDPPPSREAAKGAAPDVSLCVTARSGSGRCDPTAEILLPIAHTLRDEHDASEDGTGRGTPLIAFSGIDSGGDATENLTPTLRKGGDGGFGQGMSVAFTQNSRSEVREIGGDGQTTGAVTSEPGAQCQNYVFESRFARNGRGAPDEIVPPLKAQSGESGKGDAAPILFSIMPQNSGKDYKARQVDVAQALMASGQTHGNQGGDVVAFQSSQSGVREGEAHATLDGNNGSRRHNGISDGMSVRRLTPRECERLQGFPDDYTLIPYVGGQSKDGPRYKALGNSMAVPVMRWIGERIQAVEDIKP